MKDIISLAMIVRDEHENLDRCLGSIAAYVDEIVVVVDSRTETDQCALVAKKYDAKVIWYEWDETKFQGARTESFKHCTGKAILWLDADDEVLDGQRIADIAREYILEKDYGSVVMPYRYSLDSEGRTDIWQLRERIVRNGCHEWKGHTHESLTPLGVYAQETLDDEIILHHEKKESAEDRYSRVFEELEEKCDKGEGSERDWFYYAISARGLGKLEVAKEAYFNMFQIFGVESSYSQQAMISFGEIKHQLGDLDGACAAYMSALDMDPEEAIPWHKMALLSISRKKWVSARVFGLQGLRSKRKMQTMGMAVPVMQYTLAPYRVICTAFMELGQYGDLEKLLDKWLPEFPDDPVMTSMRKAVDTINRREKLFRASEAMLDELSGAGNAKAIRSVVSAVPDEIMEHPYFGKYTYRVPGASRRLAILNDNPGAPIGTSLWEEGCTGAEITIVKQAEGLAGLGWDVEVYSQKRRSGVFMKNGVRYLPLGHFQPNNPHGIVMGWRNPYITDAVPNARARVCSLHDVIPPMSFRGDRNYFGAVLTQTDWHSGLYEGDSVNRIEKCNLGVDFSGICHNSQLREKKRCFYSSRIERGLLKVLQGWPRIKAAHPDAELQCGILNDSFNQTLCEKSHKHRELFLECHQLAEKHRRDGLGVYYWGRAIPQDSLYQVMASSGVWLYPTDFHEVFCYTAVEAQAHGCIPVATGVAALSETVHPGYVLEEGEDWVEQAIAVLNYEEDQGIRDNLRKFAEKFSLENSIKRLDEVLTSVWENSLGSPVIETKEMVGV